MTTRVLLVTPTVPWRHRGGIGLRSAPVFAALRRVGEVEVCVLSTTSATAVPRPDVHSFFIRDPLPRRRRFSEVRALLGRRPLQIACSERVDLPPELRGRYDLVWVFGERLYHLTAGLDARRVVLDCPDVQHAVLRRRAAAPREAAFLPRFGRFGLRRSAVAWSRWYRRAVREVDAIVVCSAEERAALGLPRTYVVPNAYPRPDCPAGDAPRPERPWTLGFLGGLNYGPNQDATRWLALQIMPEVRRRIPGAELRVGGRAGRWIDEVAGRPGVRIDGEVEDLRAWLAGCDVLTAPLRWGGGTRLKVIEALAHRIPLVATAFGVAGLGVSGERHVLTAETPETFADAVARLAADRELRDALVDHGEAHYLAHLAPEHAEAAALAVAAEVLAH